jgi:hypothetical protein
LKQGKHSVGVKRQYTGSAGKIANCQIGVSLTVSDGLEHLPIDFELFLPESGPTIQIASAKRRSPTVWPGMFWRLWGVPERLAAQDSALQRSGLRLACGALRPEPPVRRPPRRRWVSGLERRSTHRAR